MDDFGQGGQAVGGAGGITGSTRTNTVITRLAHVCLRGLQLGNGWGHVRYLTMTMLAGSYLSSLTPMTNIGASGDGADTTTRLAPAWMWACGWEAGQTAACAFLCTCALVFATTYGGLLRGEEDSSGFNHIPSTSAAPGDLRWLHADGGERKRISTGLRWQKSQLPWRQTVNIIVTYHLKTDMVWSSTIKLPFSSLTSPLKRLCVESYLNM